MCNDTIVCARIDHNTKAQATKTLHAMGLSVSDAIRLLLLRVAAEKRLPFLVSVPNAVTVEAMQELEEGKGTQFAQVEDLFQDLGIGESAFDPA